MKYFKMIELEYLNEYKLNCWYFRLKLLINGILKSQKPKSIGKFSIPT